VSRRVARMLAGDLDAETLRLRLMRALREDRDARPSRKGELHVSMFTGSDRTFCARKVYFQYMRGDDRSGPPSLVHYDGKWRESKWKYLLEKAGLLTHYQHVLRVGPLVGTPDFIIRLMRKVSIVELTGADERVPEAVAWSRLAVKKRQLRFYMGMARAAGMPVEKGFVLVESKGSNKFRIYAVEHDQEKFERLMARVAAVWKAIRAGKAPPRCGRDRCEACYPREEPTA
jgi:CRISPR/Cas system-associated exonuclease Cas4 (RecB family)